MVSLDEARAGITVGTMSLIRRAALERAGGWATWCMTEDSELAIRLHALGYQSTYLTEPYGRGLIPQTFNGYRRQRYRWTYGPVQEFQRHWRLFLPRPLAAPSALTARQKLHHANHGLDVMCIGLRTLCFPLAGAAAASMIAHHERVQMPAELWIAATCLLGGNLIMRALTYHRVVRATIRQALGGILAFAALTHVITTASLRALALQPARWQRTSKFRQRRRGLRVLTHAGSETILGLVGLLAAAALIGPRSGGIATALAIGLAVQALTYLAAPVVAIAADRGLARTAKTLTGVTTSPADVNPAWAQHPSSRTPQWPPPYGDPRWATPRAPASGGSQRRQPPVAHRPRADTLRHTPEPRITQDRGRPWHHDVPGWPQE